MNETVTIDEAIAKGRKLINRPVMLIIFATIALGFCLGLEKILPIWIIPVGFVLAFIFSWIYWSFMITKWRIWAFNNVRNVHELKKRAIQEKLIWPDDSVFTRTEIRNADDKDMLQSIGFKFIQPDIFIDDLSIADETMIYLSKSKTTLILIFSIIFLVAGLYNIISSFSVILGAVLLLIGGSSAFKTYKHVTDLTPQIIINTTGFQIASKEFYPWKDIRDEEVFGKSSGKTIRYYLTYKNPNGADKLRIDDLDIDHKKLKKLLYIYRGRNNKRMNRS